MKPECRQRVSALMGTTINDAQAQMLEARIEQSMRELSRVQRGAWFAKSESARLIEAGEHAAAQIEAAVETVEPLNQLRREKPSAAQIMREGFAAGKSDAEIRAAVDAFRAGEGKGPINSNTFNVQMSGVRKEAGRGGPTPNRTEADPRDLILEYRDLIAAGLQPNEAHTELSIVYGYADGGSVDVALTRLRGRIRKARDADALPALATQWAMTEAELNAFADDLQEGGRAASNQMERIASMDAQGLPQGVIAKRLGISTNVVNQYRSRIKKVREGLALGGTDAEIARRIGNKSISAKFVARVRAMDAGAMVLDQQEGAVARAQAQGYEGTDTGEAVEWLRANRKFGPEGMTAEARRARAKEQGWDTDRVLYHGTTHVIEQFAGSPNVESHHGAGAYLSSSPEDVARNYATSQGQDLKNRIELRAEQIQQELEDAVTDGVNRAVLKKYGVTVGQVTDRTQSGLPKVEALARELARKEIAGPHDGATMPVYVRLARPVITNGGVNPTGLRSQQAPAKPKTRPTRWDYETVYDDAGENIVSEGGPASELIDATRSALSSTGMPDKYAYQIVGQLQDEIMNNEGIDADAFERIMRDEGSIVTDYESSPGQIIQDVYRALGHDGVILKNAEREFPRMGMEPDTDHYVPFSSSNIRSIHAAFDPDFRNSANLLAQRAGQVRGDFTSGLRAPNPALRQERFRIRLYAARDMSTFLHESGHFFLEVMEMLSVESEEIAGMMADVKTWMGLDPGEAITTEGHELWARTFEAYLMEGKAPSLSLRSAFETFKQWLFDVYRSLVGRTPQQELEARYGRTALTPEIRSVMDRMLATDAEIAQARAAQSLANPLTQKQLGLDDARYAKYLATFEAAKAQAEAELRGRVMADHLKKGKRWWKQEERRFRRTATLEVNGARAYRAADWLSRGQWMDGVAAPVNVEAEPSFLEAQEAERDRAQRERAFLDRMRREPQTPEEIAQDALRRSGAGESFAPRIGGPVRGFDGPMTFEQFAGLNAETADHGALSDAYVRVLNGEDADSVRKQTGWFEGPDGKWRFEIDDSNARPIFARIDEAQQRARLLPAGRAIVGNLAAFIDHDELFRAYPALATVKVRFSQQMPAGSAETNAVTKDIVVSTEDTTEDTFSLIMHEVQHVIQFYEGFSMGGNAVIAEVLFVDLDDATAQALLADVGPNLQIDVLRDRLYRRITGEVEAYDTQNRLGLTPAEREKYAPDLMEIKVLPSPPATPQSLAYLAQRATDLGIAALNLRLRANMDPAPIFYSALTRAVETSSTTKASAAQWKATLTKTAGLKREEMEWTGVNEWLDAQEVDESAGAATVSPVDDLKAQGFELELYHKTAADFDEFKPYQHFGTVAQANMRAVGQGANVRPVLVKGKKWKRMRDTGSWKEADFRRLEREGYDGVVYLNRYEGVPLEEFEAARARGIDVDSLPDSKFAKVVPSASDSYVVFNPKNVKSRLSEAPGKAPGKPAFITRDALLAFVRANGVRVEETVLGGSGNSEEIQRELLPLIETRDRLQNLERTDFAAAVEAMSDFDARFSQFLALDARLDDDASTAELRDEVGHEFDSAMRSLNDRIAELQLSSKLEANNTKWSSYTLPGGEGYRELLLRLPSADDAAAAALDAFQGRMAAKYGGMWNYKQLTDAERAERDALVHEKMKSRDYKSSHWDEPNVLAHIRFKERVDSEGRKTLAIEEVQSDWHQAGREKGYATPALEAERAAAKLTEQQAQQEHQDTLREIQEYVKSQGLPAGGFRETMFSLEKLDTPEASALTDRYNATGDAYNAAIRQSSALAVANRVPDAPFKDNKWASLALKRMIRWAASEGFDSISWIPGDVAVERFGVERVVGMTSITRDGNGYLVYLEDPQGQAIRNLPGMARAEYGQFSMPADKVRELVGKELGDKMIAAADAKKPGEFVDFKGQDLKIGGDGMRAFYDRILVNIANDLGKKYGAKVGETVVDKSTDYERTVAFATYQGELLAKYGNGIRLKATPEELARLDGMDLDGTPTVPVTPQPLHALPITPALRDAALGGLPLFQEEKDKDPAIEPKPEGLERMKLDKAQVLEIYGPEVAEKLKPYLTGSGENRAYAAQIARDIAEAKKKTPRGKRLWVWIRDQGGIADDDVRDMIDGSRKFPGLYQKNGRGIDELARMAVETGFVEKQIDEDGYVVPVDVEALRDMLRRDLAGDEQRSAQFAGEREAGDAGDALLASYEAIGVDTRLTGEALLRSIMAATEGERLGVDIDEAAATFGFSSGDELVQALLTLRPKSEVIQELTRQRMTEQYGDAFEDGTLQAEAEKAAHTEAQQRTLDIEMEAFARATGGRARAMIGAAKAVADRQLQAMSIRQVMNPDQYLAAERRFGLAAQRALEAGDKAAALDAKRKQLVSWHLYRAIRAAGDKAGKTMKRWDRLANNAATRKAIAPEHLDQIDAILERIDLRRVTAKQERASQAQWFMSLEEQGLSGMLAIDPETLAQIGARPVRSMTLAEFSEVADAIANIEHIGRNAGKFLAAQRAQELQERINAAAAQMDSLSPLEGQTANMAPTGIDKIAERWRQWHADLTRPEFLFRLLDGNKDNGPVWNLLFRPFAEAENYETSLRRAVTAELDRVFAAYTPAERAELYSRHIFVPELGQGKWTKQNLIALALNWGNEGNRAAVMNGTGWNPAQVMTALGRLTEKDWQVVQGVWDTIDRLWPQIAEQERALTGVVPEKVQAAPLMTQFGEMRGGYYPLKYDGRRSLKVADREGTQTVQEMFGARFTRAATRKGHTKERVGSGGLPVRLEMDVLAEHVSNVTHDLAFRRAVIDANRIIANPVFEAAFVRVAGREHASKLKDWLRSVAVDQPEPSTLADKILSRIRRNTSVVAMGYRISTALTQVSGFVNLIPRVGVVPLSRAIGKLYANPFATARAWEMISSKSEYMRSRPKSLDRDVRELLAKMEKRGPVSFVQRHAFDLIAALDWFVASAGWTAAYDAAINGKIKGIDAGNEIDAVAHADQVIRMTQSAGAPKDLPAVMRGSELMKQLTGFYSFLSVYYNQVNIEQIGGLRSGSVSFPMFVRNMFVISILGPLLTALIAGRFEEKDDEDEEERNKRIAMEVLAFQVAGVPGLRDVAAAGLQDYTYAMSPSAAAIKTMTEGAGTAADYIGGEPLTKADAKRLANAVGYAAGLPTGQAWVTGDYLVDLAEGEEDPANDPGDAFREAFVSDRR